MYIGWTYEIDAEAEVIYTNVNPAGWAVDHTWTWGTLPYVNHVGRGRGTDFFCDFRFAKVLEIEDRDTTRCIPVTCKVRDVRYPQFMIYDQDTDDVCFDVGSIDYNPADLRCVHLKDVTMFESGEEFHMFFDIEKGRIHSKLFVKLERGSGSERKFLKLIYGRTYKDDKYLTAFMIENGASKVYVDVDPFKFTNGNKGTDNLKLMKQLVGYQRPTNKMVGVIFDNAIDGGDLSPQNDVSEVGTLGFLTAAFGELGTGWDIIHHNRLTEEQCANNPFWDQYDTFIYYDRGIITEELPDLGHVKRLAKLGTARLIILGDHINARKLSFDVTKISRSENKVDLIGQIIDPTICDPHPVTNGITLVAGSCHTSYLNEKDFEEELDLILLTPEIICEPSVDDTIGIIRFKMIENDFDQPTRRNYIVTVYDSLGVEIGTPCSRHVAYIDIIDDETQETVDGSITVHNIHRINEPFTTYETLILRANTWYSWNNKLYTDVSSNKFIYKIGFENCGELQRQVEGQLQLRNSGSHPITGFDFNGSPFSINAGNTFEFRGVTVRRTVDGTTDFFENFTVTSPMENDQPWDIRFRVIDQNPCAGEPPAPVYCDHSWRLLSDGRKVLDRLPDEIISRCEHFTGYIMTQPCGEHRDSTVGLYLENPSNDPVSLYVSGINGLLHQQDIPARSSVNLTLVTGHPISDTLPWMTIVKFELIAHESKFLPKFTGSAQVEDPDWCSEVPEHITCLTTMLLGSDVLLSTFNVDVVYVYESTSEICTRWVDCKGFHGRAFDFVETNGEVRYLAEVVVQNRSPSPIQWSIKKRHAGGSDLINYQTILGNQSKTVNYTLTKHDFGGALAALGESHKFCYLGEDDPNYRVSFKYVRQCFFDGAWHECYAGEILCSDPPTFAGMGVNMNITQPWANNSFPFGYGGTCYPVGSSLPAWERIYIENVFVNASDPKLYIKIEIDAYADGWDYVLALKDRSSPEMGLLAPITHVMTASNRGKHVYYGTVTYTEFLNPHYNSQTDVFFVRARPNSAVFNPISATVNVTYSRTPFT